MFKAKLYLVIGITAVAAVMSSACASETPISPPTFVPTSPQLPVPETEHKNQAIITDSTGREWDVTHARDVYGMNPGFFNFSKNNRRDDFISLEDPGPMCGFLLAAAAGLVSIKTWKHVFFRG